MKRMSENRQLSEFVKMNSPEAVLAEGKVILNLISPDFNADPVISVFNSTISLYHGNWEDYHACNTEYHDLRHITDTFLAMARLIHGGILDGHRFTHRGIVLGLVSTLLHDTGYIRDEKDLEGTGAKYTAQHVQRSMVFLERHASKYGLPVEDVKDGQAMILCTDLGADISRIEFSSKEIELLGKMLGSADLLAQMADRTYLEKLLFLYYEFEEGEVGDYENEVDLLRKTIGFFDFIDHRFKTVLDATNRFMKSHFASRWGIPEDFYDETIEKHKRYLMRILETPENDPLDSLRREGIADRVRREYRKAWAKERER